MVFFGGVKEGENSIAYGFNSNCCPCAASTLTIYRIIINNKKENENKLLSDNKWINVKNSSWMQLRLFILQ